MHLARTGTQFPFERVAGGSVVTIGAFDGLHLGHQQLLYRVLDRAAAAHMPSVVMSFEPMPKEFFATSRPPARLMRFREKFEALRNFGIDLFFCPRFDDKMRDIGAATFIRQVLVQTLNVRHLIIGDDFRFARRREGTVDDLHRAGRALGYRIDRVDSVFVGKERVSSTAIRDALWAGDMQRAIRMLGRPYCMSGTVVAGQRLGRQLGFPTANVDLRRRQSPVMGIFAARVRGIDGVARDAVASVGARPTFNGTKPILEVHLFDFSGDLYGHYIQVDFIGRIRDQKKFDTVDELVQQMHDDAMCARKILAAQGAM